MSRWDFLVGGELDEGDEEVVNLADDVHEAGEVDGFGDVGVGVQVVAAHDVLLGLGGGEDDDGDSAELFVELDLGEHLTTVHPRQVEVEQNQPGSGCVGMLALAAQKSQRCGAVCDNM